MELEKKKPGRPKKVVATASPAVIPQPDGSVELPVEDIRNITTTSRKRVSLANPEFDPFKKHKTEPNKFHYRALNTRAHNIRKREAEGYQTIPGSEYGDLILGKLPKEIRKEREDYIKEKTEAQKQASVERFREEAERGGVESYEEK